MDQSRNDVDAARPRSWRRKAAAGAVVVAVAFVSTLVLAEWLASGTGEGYARAGVAEALTTESAVAAASLYPGTTGDLVLRVNNPNPFSVTLTSVQPDGPITSDDPDCDLAGHGVTFSGHAGSHVLAASSVTELLLADVVSMASTSADECQGATFTIPVSLNGGSGGDSTTTSTSTSTTQGTPPDGTPCNDGDFDTVGDFWWAGVCIGSPNQQPWYADDDGDGFGNAAISLFAVDQPSGYVGGSNDCDDTRADVNPGAEEVADPDNVDEDCDGHADNDDPQGALGSSTWYRDLDGDLYGNAANSLVLADAIFGYVATGDDCDDNDPTTFPGATEVLGDSKDNDCDGTVDG